MGLLHDKHFRSQGVVMSGVYDANAPSFDHLRRIPTIGDDIADLAHAAVVLGAEGIGVAIDTARKVGTLAQEAYFVGAALGSAVLHAATDSVESWH